MQVVRGRTKELADESCDSMVHVKTMIFPEIALFQRVGVVNGKAIMVWRDCSQVRE